MAGFVGGNLLKRITGYGVVRVSLAVILLVAAGLKAHQLATSPVIGDGFLNSRWVLISEVEFELFLGLWLLAGLLPRLTWAVAIGCFSFFACISLYKALSGAASCGCFGRVEVNPWYTSIMDVACVLALLRWRPSGIVLSALFSRCHWRSASASTTIAGQTTSTSRGWLATLLLGEQGSASFSTTRALAVIAVWLVMGIPAALAMGTYEPALLSEDGVILGNDNLVILEPEKWAGKRFPLLPFIEDTPGQLKQGERPLRERLAKGRWIVVLYHHDCLECQEAIPKYEKLARQSANDPTSPRVALIEVPPYGDIKSSFKLSPNASCTYGQLSNEKEWFIETPVVLSFFSATINPGHRLEGNH